MAEAYQRHLVPAVFGPFARDLADRAARLGPGRVLEVAAGTGVLTGALLERLPSAEVIATDLNQAMVEIGRQRVPGAVWRTADAMDLPFGDAGFDLVLCQFGVMFFPDKPAAFSEIRRVLVGGGRCLLNAWGPVEAHDFESAVVAACDRLFPHDPPRFIRSVPHYYAEVDDLVADAEAGGLQVIDVEELVLASRVQSAAGLAAGYCLGTPLRSEIESRAVELDDVIDVIARDIGHRLDPEASTGHMLAHVVTCRRAD